MFLQSAILSSPKTVGQIQLQIHIVHNAYCTVYYVHNGIPTIHITHHFAQTPPHKIEYTT